MTPTRLLSTINDQAMSITSFDKVRSIPLSSTIQTVSLAQNPAKTDDASYRGIVFNFVLAGKKLELQTGLSPEAASTLTGPLL